MSQVISREPAARDFSSRIARSIRTTGESRTTAVCSVASWVEFLPLVADLSAKRSGFVLAARVYEVVGTSCRACPNTHHILHPKTSVRALRWGSSGLPHSHLSSYASDSVRMALWHNIGLCAWEKVGRRNNNYRFVQRAQPPLCKHRDPCIYIAVVLSFRHQCSQVHGWL